MAMRLAKVSKTETETERTRWHLLHPGPSLPVLSATPDPRGNGPRGPQWAPSAATAPAQWSPPPPPPRTKGPLVPNNSRSLVTPQPPSMALRLPQHPPSPPPSPKYHWVRVHRQDQFRSTHTCAGALSATGRPPPPPRPPPLHMAPNAVGKRCGQGPGPPKTRGRAGGGGGTRTVPRNGAGQPPRPEAPAPGLPLRLRKRRGSTAPLGAGRSRAPGRGGGGVLRPAPMTQPVLRGPPSPPPPPTGVTRPTRGMWRCGRRSLGPAAVVLGPEADALAAAPPSAVAHAAALEGAGLEDGARTPGVRGSMGAGAGHNNPHQCETV